MSTALHSPDRPFLIPPSGERASLRPPTPPQHEPHPPCDHNRGGAPLAPPQPVPIRPAEAPGSYSLRHRQRPWVAHQKLVAISFVGDACMVVGAMVMAYLLRFETALRHVGVGHPSELNLHAYLGHIVFGSLLLLFLLANFRLHDPRHYLAIRRTFAVIVKACVFWALGFLALALMFKINPSISRLYCAIGCVLSMGFLMAWRWFLYCVLRRDSFAEALRQKVVFVGWNDDCARAVRRLTDGRAQRMSVSGVIAPPGGGLEVQPPFTVPVLGGFHELRPLVRESGADLVMAVDGTMSREDMAYLAECCGKEFVDFKLVPSCFQVLVSGLQLESFHGIPVLGVGKLPLHHAFNNAVKRSIDILGAIVGLIVSAPVVAFFCLMVRLESRGPVIYRQRRIGLNGKPFDILKIRSMKLNAESNGAPGWTVKDDPRRLRVGKMMREWNIDELPPVLECSVR